MKTLRNSENGKFATIVNNGQYGFTVHFGYSNKTNDAYGNDTCTNRKVFKTEKMAERKANEYLA